MDRILLNFFFCMDLSSHKFVWTNSGPLPIILTRELDERSVKLTGPSDLRFQWVDNIYCMSTEIPKSIISFMWLFLIKMAIFVNVNEKINVVWFIFYWPVFKKMVIYEYMLHPIYYLLIFSTRVFFDCYNRTLEVSFKTIVSGAKLKSKIFIPKTNCNTKQNTNIYLSLKI